MRVAYVIGTYPLLTTTFIDREIDLLRSWDVDLDVVSIRQPTAMLSADQQDRRATVRYVRPAHARSVIAAQVRALASRAYWSTLWELVREPHPSWRARLRTAGHVAVGAQVAHLLRGRAPDRVHAHFVDRAAVVALTAARLLGVPYSATAHANDIYVDPVLLPLKLSRADFVATCTGFNLSHLRETLGAAADGVELVYHGLDVEHYGGATRSSELGPSSDPAPPRLLAVGQLKEKKGYAVLLDACAALMRDGRVFTCTIVGEGPDRADLERRIAELGLESVVELTGALGHDAVMTAYQQASVFVLPCLTTADGDRDGIPNVIIEAMASGLPVVSTRHSGVPEAVDHGVTGLLVAPGDAVELTAALAEVLDDAGLRRRLGTAGYERAADCFDIRTNTKDLYDRFAC